MKKRVYVAALAVAAVGILLVSCRTHDIRTVEIKLPELKNEACEKIIAAALRRTDGIIGDSIRFGPQSVTLRYDSMKLAIMNIQFIIAEAGFTANDTPAVKAARDALPAECR